jgi:hypothetical protein
VGEGKRKIGAAQTEGNTTPTGTAMSNNGSKIIPPWGLDVKVPSTGGLAALSGSEPVAGKRGGGGYDFQKCVVEYAK